jgi:hypothetical protein
MLFGHMLLGVPAKPDIVAADGTPARCPDGGMLYAPSAAPA